MRSSALAGKKEVGKMLKRLFQFTCFCSLCRSFIGTDMKGKNDFPQIFPSRFQVIPFTDYEREVRQNSGNSCNNANKEKRYLKCFLNKGYEMMSYGDFCQSSHLM